MKKVLNELNVKEDRLKDHEKDFQALVNNSYPDEWFDGYCALELDLHDLATLCEEIGRTLPFDHRAEHEEFEMSHPVIELKKFILLVETMLHNFAYHYNIPTERYLFEDDPIKEIL